MVESDVRKGGKMEKRAAGSPFSKLIQVGLVVRDIDKAVERFSSLGIGPFTPKILPAGTKEWLQQDKPLNAKFKIKATKIGRFELELVQPIEGESPHKEFLDNKGEGIQHLAFIVADLDKEVDELTKHGAKMLFTARWQGGGLTYLDLNVAGLIVELIQPSEPKSE